MEKRGKTGCYWVEITRTVELPLVKYNNAQFKNNVATRNTG